MEDERGGRKNGSKGTALARRNEDSSPPARMKVYDLSDVPIYASTGTRVIPLGKDKRGRDYFIEIKEELDFGEQTILDNASVIGIQRERTAGVDDAASTVRLDMTRQRFLLCAVWIVNWRVPNDDNDKPIRWPRNPNDRIEAIKALNPKWGDAIVEIIAAHVAERTQEENEAQEEADKDAMMDAPTEHDGTPEGEAPKPSPSLDGEFAVVGSSPN